MGNHLESRVDSGIRQRNPNKKGLDTVWDHVGVAMPQNFVALVQPDQVQIKIWADQIFPQLKSILNLTQDPDKTWSGQNTNKWMVD